VDGKIAYVLTNRFESFVGIDLDSGKQVFRANFSTPQRRVKGFFATAVSADGRELYVHQAPVVLGRSEYKVEDTSIAVFDTADGWVGVWHFRGGDPLRDVTANRLHLSPSSVAHTTNFTLTATDGVYTFNNVLTVLPAPCSPTTCAAQGKDCGSISDGCGGTLYCGSAATTKAASGLTFSCGLPPDGR